jgi:hypothetical protein
MPVLGTDLTAVKKVYMFPMRGNLDQYLANRLVPSKTFQVVVDPSQAEAVFTDQLGEGFEARLEQLRNASASGCPCRATESDRVSADTKQETENQSQQGTRMRFSGSSRGNSTVFLVDIKSGVVLWSAYEKAGGSSPGFLDKAAARLVRRLQRDLKRK